MALIRLPLDAASAEGASPGTGLTGQLAGAPSGASSAGFSQLLAETAEGAAVRRTVLPCGTRVLTERMPGLLSAAVGFWVGVGSRDERPGHLGATHFLEHLLFKGTGRRSALEIAESFDRVGGESNALTAKEHTCYYARVLAEQVPMAVDVLADMMAGALLDPQELERERQVILEELAMDQDDPEDVAFERFIAQVLHGNPLARPIGGTPEEITGVSRERVLDHYHEHYQPESLVVTAAGGVEHDQVVEQVTAALQRAGWDPWAPGAPRPRRTRASADAVRPAPLWGRETTRRPLEQAHLLVGRPGLVAGDPRRYQMIVLNAALGGGMSSRLFQEVRERRGLAYSTFSFSTSYSDAGLFGMYAGCASGKVEEVLAVMRGQLEQVAADGLADDELAKVQGQLAGSTVLALEDSGSRMSRLGSAELITGEYLDLDETLSRVRAVTAEQVRALAAELAQGPVVEQLVGPAAG